MTYRPPVQIVPFGAEHVDIAAELLAERHARHREVEPLLPDDVDFRAEIEKQWSLDGAHGVISLDGYLLGAPNPALGFRAGVAGHAARDAETARDLYAAAAQTWLDAGYPHHEVFVPASDVELVNAWFRLDFGAGATLAMRATAGEAPFSAPGVEIRAGTPDDLEASAQLDRVLSETMVPAPSFSSQRILEDHQYVEEWVGTWNDPQCVHFVAELHGRVVGHSLLYHRPHDLRVPKDSIDLANAATLPEFRGRGVSRALTSHVITWAYEHGHPTMTTDWRMTNLLASRFWPKRGFRETFLRLHRNLA